MVEQTNYQKYMINAPHLPNSPQKKENAGKHSATIQVVIIVFLFFLLEKYFIQEMKYLQN